MSNPVCISPLKFYDSLAKQSHRKSYAYGHISPLITKTGWIPPFQFVIPTQLYNNGGVINEATTYNTAENVLINLNGTTSGAPSTRWGATDFIPVSEGQVFSFTGGSGDICLAVSAYSSNTQNSFISGSTANIPYSTPYSQGGGAVETITFIIPAGVNYIRLCKDRQILSGETFELLRLGGNTVSALIINAKTDEIIGSNRLLELVNAGFNILNIDRFRVATFKSVTRVFTDIPEGIYYLKLASVNDTWAYYSEVFCFDNVTKDCLELEYWNETGNFAVKNGVIAFPAGFHFKLLLKGEIGKPEYNFEEESTKRLGYIYVESQVSKKTYKFNTIVPEYICDALRLVRLCDNKIIRCKDDEYEAITFEMEAEWQTQGDLASVTCEFETDNIIANIGGFVPDKLGGDYNNDYNEDFDKE